jgi:hypothetical protein
MSLVWNIKYQAHSNHVTCQRPIILGCRVTSGQVAHFRAGLLMETSQGSNSFNPTGVEFNAYAKGNAGYAEYECNVAEYCRQYIAESRNFLSGNWCASHADMYNRRFKVMFSPVIIQNDGTLDVDYNDSQESKSFNVLPLNTQVWENNSADENDYHRIDKYVLNGGNGGGMPSLPGDFQKHLTNMPNNNEIVLQYGNPYYLLQVCIEQFASRQLRVRFTNSSGSSKDITYAVTNVDGVQAITVHPFLVEFLVWINTGSIWNGLLDASGNINTEYYDVKVDFVNSSGSVTKSGPPAIRYKMINYEDCGGKNQTTFLFRNMRGGIDWFTAKGREEKSVSITGTTFDRHTFYDRNSRYPAFGTMVGQHSTTNLWNDRKDEFSVFSQAVTDEQAQWLEELIVSPQVWIIKPTDSPYSVSTGYDEKLVAIVIDKASYNIYNTEKNVSYIEFKYSLSEHTLTQKN